VRVEKLAKTHDRSTFRCGRDELDEWFHTAAMQAQRRNRSARTTVLVDDDTVVGFYSLATLAVAWLAWPSTRTTRSGGWANASWPPPYATCWPPPSMSESC
jgi:hypothetical protein